MGTRVIPDSDRLPTWLPLVGLVGLCLAVGFIGGQVTAESVRTWYPTLAKPSFQPPGAVFGPVWTVLYVLMAVSAWLVWRASDGATLLPWWLQLALNAVWSPIFFGAQAPLPALFVIVALLAAIVWTIVRFAHHSKVAAWLLAPYLAWVSFATVLNASIVALN